MKHILLPTDFSENALNSIFTAVKLYTDFKCTFYVMHAYEPKVENISGFKSSTRAGQTYQSLAEQSKKELAKTVSYITSDNEQHSFKTLSMVGGLIEAIKEAIPKYDIDIIVMGTKGATGAKAVFMGSNTARVLKAIKNCTVIAVPKAYDLKSLKSVVFPTEYARFFPKRILEPFLELINTWKSEVKIFHVAQEFKLSDEQQANKQILKKRFEACRYSFFKVNIKTTVSKAIRNFSEEQNADLIVLTNYKHSFFEQLTQEPIVKKVGFKSVVPLMVLPDFEG